MRISPSELTMSCRPRQLNKFISFLGISLGGTMTFSTILTIRGDETFYSKALMPLVTKFVDPELAHDACIFLTKHRIIRCQSKLTPKQEQMLKTNVMKMNFANPVGLAAGFDKNSQAVFGLNHYGLGFAEVGTVTPRPQDGNPKKRIFRIPQEEALVNRCGFNNKGIEFVTETLSQVKSFRPMLVGLNLGKNKDTSDISSDYLIGLKKSKDLESIDYLVINISSPNTPGLRDSQEKKNLERLLDDVLKELNSLSITKPLLVKVAPDLSDSQIKDIADVVTKKRVGEAKVSGIILTNTTISRPLRDSRGQEQSIYEEAGGLSGKPLRDISTEVIGKFYKLTKGKLPIVGVGGVSTGQDAYDKLRAGASLVQLYTSLTYQGPPVINRIKRELVELLEKDKLSTVEEAVGLDHRSR